MLTKAKRWVVGREKQLVPIVLILPLLSLALLAALPADRSAAAHTLIMAYTVDSTLLEFGPKPMWDGAKANVSCVADSLVLEPFTLVSLELETSLDAGDDLNIDQILVDGETITSNNGPLPEINVNRGPGSTRPPIIPLALPYLAASKSIAFALDQQSGNIADDAVSGRAFIWGRNGANCTLELM